MKNFALCIFSIFSLLLTPKLEAQELTMFNGAFGQDFYQDTKPISKKSVGKLMEYSEETHIMWKKSKTMSTLGWVSTGVFVYTYAELLSYDGTKGVIPSSLIISFFGSMLASGTFLILNIILKRKLFYVTIVNLMCSQLLLL